MGETFAKLGYLVYSVDIDPRLHPSIVVDVTVWQYWKCFRPLFFDVIASSPPCTEYSRALMSRPRNLAAADKIVLAALEIIEYFQPTFWFMENPQRGLLIDRDFRKAVRVWT